MRLDRCNLSDGQQILLQIAHALTAKGHSIDGTILLLDEPELHLHPEAQVDFIESLKSANPNGQLWLATHSVHILSSLAQDELWFVHDGTVAQGGKTPKQVISALVGNETRQSQLLSFLSLPAILASARFASECLTPPLSLWTGRQDPQINQIAVALHSFLESRDRKESAALRVLDYGAGKGRILQALGDHAHAEYFAYEKDSASRHPCLEALRGAYGAGADQRFFSRENDLLAFFDDGAIDLCIMCNVIHEVSPTKWISDLFGRSTALMRLLSEDGYLLIVEDNLLPRGEQAHQYGFIVLDTEHLKALFNVKQADIDDKRFVTQDHSEPRYKGRLKAHLVHKQLLAQANADTRCDALERVVERARSEIQELRSKQPGTATYLDGQLFGFWSQQYTNADLALRDLGCNTKIGARST